MLTFTFKLTCDVHSGLATSVCGVFWFGDVVVCTPGGPHLSCVSDVSFSIEWLYASAAVLKLSWVLDYFWQRFWDELLITRLLV